MGKAESPLASWHRTWPRYLRVFARRKRESRRPGTYRLWLSKRIHSASGRVFIASLIAAVVIPNTSWRRSRRLHRRRIGKRGLGLPLWAKRRVPCYVLWELVSHRSVQPVQEWRTIPLHRIPLERVGNRRVPRPKDERFWRLRI